MQVNFVADLFNRWKQGGGGDETHRKWVLLEENADGKKETHKNRERGEKEIKEPGSTVNTWRREDAVNDHLFHYL